MSYLFAGILPGYKEVNRVQKICLELKRFITILQLVTRQTILNVSRKNKSHRHLGNKYHVMQIHISV